MKTVEPVQMWLDFDPPPRRLMFFAIPSVEGIRVVRTDTGVWDTNGKRYPATDVIRSDLLS